MREQSTHRGDIMGNLQSAVYVQTQYRENYGAHDWNGVGECPQYWKCKFGSDYIILSAPSAEEAEAYVTRTYGHRDHYSQEYVIASSVVDASFQTEMEKISDGECSAVRIEWDDVTGPVQ